VLHSASDLDIFEHVNEHSGTIKGVCVCVCVCVWGGG
jgi:hypothetical protein